MGQQFLVIVRQSPKQTWPFHDGGRYHIETSPLKSVMKELSAIMWIDLNKSFIFYFLYAF